jgi:hypothetical protein
MESLLSLFIQPALDKFHDFKGFSTKFDFSDLMRFGFWYFTYREEKKQAPAISSYDNQESVKSLCKELAEEPNEIGLRNLIKAEEIDESLNYEQICGHFEEEFKLMPSQALDHVVDLYVNTIDGMYLSPAFAALLTHMAEYKEEEGPPLRGVQQKSTFPHLCLWSQPRVNHRRPDITRLDDLRDAFLYDENNIHGLSFDEYVCFPYVVSYEGNEDGWEGSMHVESMVKAADLKREDWAESLLDHAKVAEDLYNFAFGERFEDTTGNISHRPYQIVASALHKMNQKYRGLGDLESVRGLYRDLLGICCNAETFPDQAMNSRCEDYAQLFHSCRIAFQAFFPLRLGMVDGGHRIIVALAAIYNVRPSITLGETKSFLQKETLDLQRVCLNVKMKMAWPKCSSFDTKQSYDIMVSR